MDELDESGEPVVFSEQVEQEIARATRREQLLIHAYNVLWLLGGILWLASSASALFVSETVSIHILVVAVGVLAAAMVVSLLHGRIASASMKQLLRMVNIETRLELLQLQHPELVTLKTVLELVNEEKNEVSGRHSFWIGSGQSLFFLVLGILVSYVLARLGWLR